MTVSKEKQRALLSRLIPGKPKNGTLVGQKHEGVQIVAYLGYDPKRRCCIWQYDCVCGSNNYITTTLWNIAPPSRCPVCALKKISINNWRGCGDLSGTYWNRIIAKAKLRNFVVTITCKYAWELFIRQNKKCALTGIALNMTINCSKNTASLDRINSANGYIPDNVQWVHKEINKMKMDITQDRFIELCMLVSKQHRNNNDKSDCSFIS